MKELFLGGRVLLGAYLLFSGVHHFSDREMLVAAAAHHGVPHPMLAVLVAGVLLVIGGISFLLGLAPRVGIGALVLFFVPVTLMMHPFWNESGMSRTLDLMNFSKNFALLGAILMAGVIPEPWPYGVEGRAHPHHVDVSHSHV